MAPRLVRRGILQSLRPVPVLLALAHLPLAAQGTAAVADSGAEEVVVAPGAQYRAGWLHRTLLGNHYRALWTTPLRVPILDLNRFAGGLRPLRVGGGMQTKSLRFAGADGREYVFRPFTKDPTQRLPPELRTTIAGRISRDQVSALHPAGPLVASALLEAAGVLHVTPILVVLPRGPALGRFESEFAGVFGLLEERPTSDADSLSDGRRVVGTAKLYQLLDADAGHQVDAPAFLNARLMDVYLGDWDRHLDQWRWVTRGPADSAVWQPIPRDRDYVFSKFDGLLLQFARQQQPQWVGFGDRYPSIFGLTWYGRALDRRLLSGLEWAAWDSVARGLQARLTDSVIDVAVGRLPPEMRALNAAELGRALRARRDGLTRAARDFYRVLSRQSEVWATDQPNRARVERGGDTLDVALYADTDADRPFFRRRFARAETREVRLFLRGGDDRVDLRGQGGGPLLRIVGGGGRDQVIDSSVGGRLRVYDRDPNTRMEGLHAGRVDRRAYADFTVSDSTRFPPRDWGEQWRPLLWLNVEPEVGVFLGGGVVRYGFGFRRSPHASKTQIRAGYATNASAVRADFRHQVWFGAPGTSATLYLRASGIEVLRFYGFGNETERQGDDQFHRVPQEHYVVAPSLSFGFGQHGLMTLGPVLKYSDTRLQSGRFISLNPPAGVGQYGALGLRGDYLRDGRDLPLWPRRGTLLTLGGSVYPALWDVEGTFGEVHGEAAAYLSPELPLHPTLAVRVGGKRVWGAYPFHEAAYLGRSNVRGLRSERYAGDAAVYAGAELRVPLFRPYLVIPGEMGVLGFTDVGRVYLEGESSDRWHTGFGAGLWFSFLRRANTITLAVARGDDRTTLYFRAGFGY